MNHSHPTETYVMNNNGKRSLSSSSLSSAAAAGAAAAGAVGSATTTTTLLTTTTTTSSSSSSRIDKKGAPLTEQKLRRLEKNRLSARECRRRKREATEQTQRHINLLEGENLRLRLQLQVRNVVRGCGGIISMGYYDDDDLMISISWAFVTFFGYGIWELLLLAPLVRVN